MSSTIIDFPFRSASRAGAVQPWHAVLVKSIKHGIAQIREHRRLRRDTDELLARDDRLLADIGLRRCELEYARTAGALRMPRPTMTARPGRSSSTVK
jgi:uncharacterized protein YjiS (DUF1127 family)